MGLTSYPNGISSFGMPVFGGGYVTQGKHWFVKPYSGSDAFNGETPDTAFKTLAQAQSAARADKNDIVFLFSESNSAALTTDYQSSTLTWAKDGVHLIGVGSGAPMSQRARVGLISSYVTASNLITISADNCFISNVQFFAGVADTNPTGCMSLTGSKNRFQNCHIAGIGSDEMDIAGAYSLKLTAAHENLFDQCVIGIDTIGRGSAANAEIYLASASARNIFRSCLIQGLCASAGNYLFVSANAAAAIDRYVIFDNCIFHNPGAASAGAQMTQAFQFHAAVGGTVVLHKTTIVGAANVNAADIGTIWCGAGTLPYASDVTDLGLALATTNA